MAEQAAAGKGKQQQPPADDERAPTRRVILKREQVIVLPEGIDPAKVAEAGKALGIKQGATVDAWLVVAEKEGASKREAIEAHAGKAGTPDAIPGDYKAPPLSGFSGGERYVRPDKPKVERQALED